MSRGGGVAGRRPWAGPIAIAIALIALAIAATPAHAASTRAEYVAQVDQTCAAWQPGLKKENQAIVKAGVRILKLTPDLLTTTGAAAKEALRKLNRLNSQVRQHLRRFNLALGQMVEQVALVSPAPGDEAAAAHWVGGLRQYLQLGARSERLANHGKFGKSLSLLDQSQTVLDRAGSAVQGFGISVCPTSSESSLF